jgi:plasmid stabilization system protein ParE
MARYRVVFSETAESDLDDIVNYLSGFSSDIAFKYYDEIVDKTNSHSKMPERCPFVSDVILRKKGYRWLFVRNYIVFFVVEQTEGVVDIRRVLYSHRDYTALL